MFSKENSRVFLKILEVKLAVVQIRTVRIEPGMAESVQSKDNQAEPSSTDHRSPPVSTGKKMEIDYL